MLKKIKVGDLVLGMYFCGFAASGPAHPFWTRRFLLSRESDLRQARESGISYCWIDVARGLDIDADTETDVELQVSVDDAQRRQTDAACTTHKTGSAMNGRAGPGRASAIALRDHAHEVTRDMFDAARMGKALELPQCVELVKEISRSVLRDPNDLLSVLRIKLKDEYTYYLHSVSVCALMVALGRTLGLTEAACREAGLSGYLHDVGKAFIDADILNKPGKLSQEEFALIKQHPELGYQYLIQNPDMPAYVSDVCRHHHERLDGRGYPDGLPAEFITLYARMAAVCDVYDALTSERPYKHGWDPAEAICQMARWEGHLDRRLLLAFAKTLGIYPVGSLVRLESGLSRLVIRHNPADLTRSDSIIGRGDEEWTPLRHLDPPHARGR